MLIKLAIIADPIDSLNPEKDTSIAMLRAAAVAGCEIYFIAANQMYWQDGKVLAHAQLIQVIDQSSSWYYIKENLILDLSNLGVILMRKDPPVDSAYIYVTHLLSILAYQGVLVVNDPQSLRDCNEKLFALEFADLCAPTLVTSSKEQLIKFRAQHQDIVLKPLNGLAGRGIFRLQEQDSNISVIWQHMTNNGIDAIIAQKFIPQIAKGDKRIILIDGQPLDKALLRVPAQGEFRANLAAGGAGIVSDLTERDRFICRQLAPELQKRGLSFVGIDVIGEYLTEINITSPTGIVEITAQSELDGAHIFMQWLMQDVKSRSIQF